MRPDERFRVEYRGQFLGDGSPERYAVIDTQAPAWGRLKYTTPSRAEAEEHAAAMNRNPPADADPDDDDDEVLEPTPLEDVPTYEVPDEADCGLVRIFREAGLGHFLEDTGGES